MKKTQVLLISLVVFSLAIPAAGMDIWRIRLKNGGEFTTPKYWREGGAVRFYIYDGVMGVRKDSIRAIEKVVAENVRYVQSEIKSETGPASTAKAREDEENQEKVDIPEYIEKKEHLAAELDRTLERLREATRRRDAEAKEREQQEMRRITAEIYALTDEVKEKNNGKVPDGWWKEE